MTRTTASYLTLVVMLIACPEKAWADAIDDVLGGFDEGEELEADASSQNSDNWNLTGDIFLKTSYNFRQYHPESGEADYSGLSKLQAGIRLQLDLYLPHDWKARISGRAFHDFAYAINGRGLYTREVLNLYEQELEFQEVYLQGELLPNLDLKVGRQVVNWGLSDTLRVLDVLNPIDNREPGVVDLEDLRLPVTMSKADYYFDLYGDWNLSAILIHERRFDEAPVFGSDFFPSATRLPRAKDPASWRGNYEYAFALKGTLEGWDLSFHYARIYNDQPHIEVRSSTVLPFFFLRSRHGRMTMYGASLNISSGSWIFKSEAGYFEGVRLTVDLGNDHDRLDTMLGVEYMGFSKTVISLEVVNRHIRDHSSTLLSKRNSLESALRINRKFFNDNLDVTALAVWFSWDGEGGSTFRLSGEYDLTDNITLGGGVIFYNDGNLRPFEMIHRNDRAFFDMKYSF